MRWRRFNYNSFPEKMSIDDADDQSEVSRTENCHRTARTVSATCPGIVTLTFFPCTRLRLAVKKATRNKVGSFISLYFGIVPSGAIAAMQVLLLLISLVVPSYAWVSPCRANHVGRRGCVVARASHQHHTLPSPSTRLHLLNPLLAGSIAGAIGVGIAFPLDTIKTKQQAQAQAATSAALLDHSDIDFNADGTMIFRRSTRQRQQQQQSSLFQSMQTLVENQGISGLFAGVGTSMMGQAIIKSVAFSVNSAVLAYLTPSQSSPNGAALTMDPNNALLVAAATSGFVTAFLATPIDRIKVLRQCNSGEECYLSDMDCLKSVLQHEGLQGLLFRGLGPTFFREVPAYTIYFSTFGWLHATFGDDIVPGATTLLYGALAGGLCVLPSYPADVIKTLVQNSNGSRSSSNKGDDADADDVWKIVQEMYETQGMAGFWDGLSPRMLRAAINHAVTFATYNALI
jgi:Mitochondrial carrier protein